MCIRDRLNTTLSTAIATQLATLPIISPASGFTFTYDASAGVYVRSTTSFGPVYSERAETIGHGKFSFGASYQRFRFSTIDGISLHNIPAVFSHVPGTGPAGADEPYEADVIQTSNSLGINMDQTLLFATVGVTDHLDLSVAVPISSVRFDAFSVANIERVSGQFFALAPSGTVLPNPHMFANGSLTNYYASTPNGSATGVGDVTIRLKQSVHRGPLFQVAAALDVRTPTGNAREFLGSGAIGVKPFIIISANRRFSPHLNLGYQWNGSSILAGNITGTNVFEQNEQAVSYTHLRADQARKRAEQLAWSRVDQQNAAQIRAFLQRHAGNPDAAAALAAAEQAEHLAVDKRAISQVLTQYQQAFTNKNIDGLLALRPSLKGTPTEKVIREAFRQKQSIVLELTPLRDADVSADSAVIQCRQSTQNQQGVSQPDAADVTVTITLSRSGQSWIVKDIRPVSPQKH